MCDIWAHAYLHGEEELSFFRGYRLELQVCCSGVQRHGHVEAAPVVAGVRVARRFHRHAVRDRGSVRSVTDVNKKVKQGTHSYVKKMI